MTRPVTQSCNLDKLPEAIGRELCTFIDPRTALELSRVNREMQRVIQKIWASLAPSFITGHFQTQLHPWIPPAEQLERLRLAESSHASIVRKMALEESCAEGCLKISKDGKKALFSGSSPGIRLWDLTTGKCLLKLGQDRHYHNLHVSSDGKRAFATTTRVFENVEKDTLTVWDLTRGKLLQEIPLLGEVADSFTLQISNDGKKALFVTVDTLLFFDLDTGEELFRTPIGGGWGYNVNMCCNGERIFGYPEEEHLQIWDLTEAPLGRCLYDTGGRLVGMSHDGTRALVQFVGADLYWLDLLSGSILGTALVLDGEELLSSISMNADETRVVFSHSVDFLEHWDLTTGKRLHILLNGEDSDSEEIFHIIKFTKVNPNGTRAISIKCAAGDDINILQLWDLNTGRCLHTISGSEDLGDSMEIDAYGMTGITRCIKSEKITVWNLAPLPEERICAVAETFRQHRPAAEEEFKQLPGFVRKAIPRPKKPPATSPVRWLGRNVDGVVGLHVKPLDTGWADNEMARNIETHIVNSRVLPVIAGIFGCADANLVPVIKRLPPLFTRRIYEFLDPVSREALMLTNPDAAGSLSTSKMIVEDAQVRFLSLPGNIKQLIFTEIVRQRAFAGTLPEDIPANYGELSFYNIGDCSTTPAEKSAAIMAVWNRLRT